MRRNGCHLTVPVDGEDRDATWEQGVGIYVAGHDFGKGDTVKIGGTPHEVTVMGRMQMHGELVTLILEAREVGK